MGVGVPVGFVEHVLRTRVAAELLHRNKKLLISLFLPPYMLLASTQLDQGFSPESPRTVVQGQYSCPSSCQGQSGGDGSMIPKYYRSSCCRVSHPPSHIQDPTQLQACAGMQLNYLP